MDIPADIVANVDEIYMRNEKCKGYIDQQLTKLLAHTYTASQYITYVDSDCIFTQPCDVTDLFKDGCPVLLKTPYAQFSTSDNVYKWKGITQHFVGYHVDYEYMRRFPLTFDRRTLVGIANDYPWLHRDAVKIPDNGFSEFNIMGAYADKYHPYLYSWVDTATDPLPELYCKQYWSWGGLTDVIRDEIEEVLA